MEIKVYRSPGKIWRSPDPKDRMWTQDQLIPEDGEIHWVKSQDLPSYLEERYGLTLQEYYNLVVYGDKDYVHKCMNSNCNNPTIWLGLSKGYQGYCSRACSGQVGSISRWDDPKQHELAAQRLSDRNKEWWKDSDYREQQSARISLDKKNNIKQLIRLSYKAEISDTNPKRRNLATYFYIAKSNIYPTWMKLGITSELNARKSNMEYGDMIGVLLPTRVDAATLEYLSKLFIYKYDLNDKASNETEWFYSNAESSIIEFVSKLLRRRNYVLTNI